MILPLWHWWGVGGGGSGLLSDDGWPVLARDHELAVFEPGLETSLMSYNQHNLL